MSKSKGISDLDLEMLQGIYTLARLENSHKKLMQSANKDDLISLIDTLLHQKALYTSFGSDEVIARLEIIAKKIQAYLHFEIGLKNAVKYAKDCNAIEDTKNYLSRIVDDFDVLGEVYENFINETYCLIDDLKEKSKEGFICDEVSNK